MKIKNAKNSKRKKIITLIVFLFILLLIAGALFIHNINNTADNSSSTTNPTVNNAPTEAEKESGNDVKQNIVDSEKDKNDTGSTTPNQAAVFITYAGQTDHTIEVNAYTTTYEEGSCTFHFKNGDRTVTKQTAATKDATTTICTNPLINTSEFAVGGAWLVSVMYKNTAGTIQGESTAQTINISL